MYIAAAMILVISIGIFSWKTSEIKRGKQVFGLAKAMEDNGHYEAACFLDAVAANAGYEPGICRPKVKDLWDTHGPFEFPGQLEDLKRELCGDRSCGEGYHRVTVRDIHRIVAENKIKGAG